MLQTKCLKEEVTKKSTVINLMCSYIYILKSLFKYIMYNVCNRHCIFILEKKIMHEYIYWRVWTSYGHNECWKKMGLKSLIKFPSVISKMGCHWPQKQVLLQSLRVNATFYTAHITKARATSSCNNSNLMQTFERLQGKWQKVVEKRRIRFL